MKATRPRTAFVKTEHLAKRKHLSDGINRNKCAHDGKDAAERIRIGSERGGISESTLLGMAFACLL